MRTMDAYLTVSRQWIFFIKVSCIIFIFIRQKRQHSKKRKWNNNWKRNAKNT